MRKEKYNQRQKWGEKGKIGKQVAYRELKEKINENT